MKINDTIVAQSTPYGESAIGLIRLTGKKSLEIVNKLFPDKNLNKVKSHTIHYGNLEYKKEIIDEVLVSIFKEPKSYTSVKKPKKYTPTEVADNCIIFSSELEKIDFIPNDFLSKFLKKLTLFGGPIPVFASLL